jgi:hypothetical protein
LVQDLTDVRCSLCNKLLDAAGEDYFKFDPSTAWPQHYDPITKLPLPRPANLSSPFHAKCMRAHPFFQKLVIGWLEPIQHHLPGECLLTKGTSREDKGNA